MKTHSLSDLSSVEFALQEIREALAHAPEGNIGIGWDGFLDRIHRVVKQRSANGVVWMDQIGQFRDLLLPGQSANAEWHLVEQRIGGNAALLAKALAPLVARVQLVATLGSSSSPTGVIQPFDTLVEAGIQVHACGQHAETDALEFADGKFFLGQMNGLLELDWHKLIELLGPDALNTFWQRSQIVCLTNWTMTPQMTSIWRGLQALEGGPGWVFVDLAEPSKRSDEELTEALNVLQKMPCRVLLGMNERESQRVARICGLQAQSELDPMARMNLIQSELGLAACVLHRKDLAIWCGKQSVQLHLPVIHAPRTLTGAGDHFNAGVVLGLLHDLSPLASLCLGHAVASFWIQKREEVSLQQLSNWTLHGQY